MLTRCSACLTLSLLLSHSFALSTRGDEWTAPGAQIRILDVFGPDAVADDPMTDSLVQDSAAQTLDLLESGPKLLPGPHTEVAARNEPSTAPRTAPTRQEQRSKLSFNSPSAGSDVLSELETIAVWSGVVILVAGGVVVALKARNPAWGSVGQQNALQRVAALQLRSDAQLMLVTADQRRYLVALDRQGIRFLEPLNRWDSSPSNEDSAELAADVDHGTNCKQLRDDTL